MPLFARLILTVAGLVVLSACADPAPPAGRWQGVYEGGDAMVAARLEIDPEGSVRVSAPNAFLNFAAMSTTERMEMRSELLAGLAAAWPSIGPMELTFDGKTFRKPGGVAPQLEWDNGRREMTLVVYPGLHDTIRFPLERVDHFGG